MQANASTVLTYILNLGSAFTITSANLNIISPDGVVNNAAVTVSPGGSANPQNLSSIYTPPVAGKYKGTWQVITTTQTLTYPFSFFVVWTDVYSSIRTLLGLTLATLPDPKIDYEFQNLFVELQAYAPIPNYWTFPVGDYQDGFDQGIGKLVAARLRPYIGGKRPVGEVSLFKKGTTTVQYTVGTGKEPYTLEKQWIEQGMAILAALIPEIAVIVADDRYGDEIMTRGPLAAGNYHSTGNWTADDWGGSESMDTNTWFGGFRGTEL
jgi:hypothetical protein